MAKKKVQTVKNDTTFAGKRTLIDRDSGEHMEVRVIDEKYSSDTNFSKIWVAHIANALDLLGNKKVKVISYIIQKMNPSNNMLDRTQQEIADDLGISRTTVNRTMKALEEAEFITSRYGVTYVNPDAIFSGKHPRRMHVLYTYEKQKAKAEGKDPDEIIPPATIRRKKD